MSTEETSRDLPVCAASNFDGVLWADCEEPGAVHLRGGCVHEHVKEDWMCERHCGRNPEAFCVHCFEADGHNCPLTFEVIRESADAPLVGAP